jgi:hypothetical protein
LEEPKTVTDATKQYREEMDTLASFLDEVCVTGSSYRVLAERLYQRYTTWCDKSGERKDPKKAFVARLEERGFERRRETAGVNKGRYIWLGIGFRSDDEPPEDGDDGSPGEPNVVQGSPGESREDTPNSSGSGGSGEPSEAKTQHPPKQSPREGQVSDSGFTGFTGFTPEQEQQIRKFVREGMSEKQAREEVLGTGTTDEGNSFGAEPKVVSIESGEPYDVYVGRGKRGTGLKKSKWHNPYVVGKDGTRDEVREKYERYLKASPLMAELPEIKGKILACHCAPNPCHADILLRLANNNPKCDHGPNDFCDECVGP